MKENKIYPGEWKIIRVLQKDGMTWTQIKKATGLNQVSLSEYLKRLSNKNIVEYDKESRKYRYPSTLQPLDPKSFPDTFEGTKTLIKNINSFRATLQKIDEETTKKVFLRNFLTFQMCFLRSKVSGWLCGSILYEDPAEAQEFIRRISEKLLVPWIQALNILVFENRNHADCLIDEMEKQAEESVTSLKKLFNNIKGLSPK